MTGQELLQKLLPTLVRIGPSEKNVELYNEIQFSLSNFVFVDSFNQLRRSSIAEGLSLEILMFNATKIHDIVISRSTISFISVLTKNVSMTYIQTNYGPVQNAAGLSTMTDVLNFTIAYGDDKPRTLVYATDVKRFNEINRIQNNLLNLVSK